MSSAMPPTPPPSCNPEQPEPPGHAKATFESALGRPTAEREAGIAHARGDDTVLIGEVRGLLAAHEDAGDFPKNCAAPPPEVQAERDGDFIGHYWLIEKLGEGGFGAVWRAEQREPIHREVALKVIKPGMDSREIIARFEAERRLRSLQRYADFFESSADGTVVLDADGHLLFSNPKAREITGYVEEDLRGRRLGDIFAPSDAHVAHELRVGFAKGEFPRGLDVRVAHKEGREIILSLSFGSVLREEGVLLCTFRDVTAERAVENELRQTKSFLERVIDSSVDAIISADMKGSILLFNRAAERVYGLPASEVLGGDVRGLYPDGGARKIMRQIHEGKGRIEGVKTEIVAASGEVVPVLLSASLLYEGDKPIGSVGIFTDLREKMRMEQKLQQAQEQLLQQERQAVIAELAGAAAHELNQPLTSVAMSAELLLRKTDKDSPLHGIAEVVRTESERMAEIVRKIGTITKYETKSYVGQAKILDLDKASEEGGHPPSGG